MIHSLNSLRLKPEIAYDDTRLKIYLSTALDIDVNKISDIVITKRSIDARQRQVIVNLSVNVYIEEKAPDHPLGLKISYNDVSNKPSVTIVGAGPAGLFAALRLIELGIRPIVIERGMPIDRRNRDVECFFSGGELNEQSNIMFGEGGAAQGRRGELPVHHMAQGFFRRAMEVRREKGDALCQIPGDLPVFFICQQLFRQRIVKYFCFAGLRMVGPGKQAHPRRHACVVHFNHLI